MAAGLLSASVMPEIVGAVYDCVADPDLWPRTLETICRMADARLAMMAVLDTVAATPRFSVAWGEEALLAPLMHDYAAEVPFYSALPMMEIDVPFTVDMIYALQGAGARETWLDSRITREWVVPNNLDDFFWLVLMRQPTRTGTFVIITDRDRHPITRAELDAVSLLSPHIRRAVTIGDMFAEERRTAGLFRAVVDALSHPVLIVDKAMRILFANPAAEQMLADRGTVSSTHGQLSFSYAEADAAVGRAVALGEHNEFALGAAGINVPLLRARAPAVAHVMPLARRDIRARMASQAAAAIFIAEAGCGPIPALDALAALFGLTAAERRVAGHVAKGRSRAEIAQASGVSDGTVKSQLAAIFDKTGTGDQRELQGLFRELSPPVRQSPTS